MIERDYQEIIRASVPRAAIYEQLAEEAAELAHAALKCARVLRGENPTPVSEAAAAMALVEEASDVHLTAEILGVKVDPEVIQRKLERWVDRLNERGEAQCAGNVGSSPSGGSGAPSAGRR